LFFKKHRVRYYELLHPESKFLQTEIGEGYNLLMSDDLATWTRAAGLPKKATVMAVDFAFVPGTRGFFKIVPISAGFSLIPAGSFQMGDALAEGLSQELPVHTVQVSAFYMAKHEVTKALWDEVRTWAAGNGYTDLPVGGGKAADHPVQAINWYAMVKWCNARSEKNGLTPCYRVCSEIYRFGENEPDCNWEANGYRLPTEAEWEKAARGGLSGKRFPWTSGRECR
jgi:formylglycine-generating enzyme required for sulfatase activity